MNLTGQTVYQKTERSDRPPNAAEKRYWNRVLKLGCIIKPVGCKGRTTLHHTGTGAGGRKNHMLVLPLCWEHHLGDDGINSLTGKISRREWEEKHGTETVLLEKLRSKLHASDR
jgi:hypothetical protein